MQISFEPELLGNGNIYKVLASSDESLWYLVAETEDGWVCSCKGYQFRSTCKHTKGMSNEPRP